MSRRKERFATLTVASSLSGSFAALVYFAYQESMERIRGPVLATLERINWPGSMAPKARELHESISINLDRPMFLEYQRLLDAAVQSGHLRLTDDDRQFMALSELLLRGLGGSWPELVALFFGLTVLFYAAARLVMRVFRAIRRRRQPLPAQESGETTSR